MRSWSLFNLVERSFSTNTQALLRCFWLLFTKISSSLSLENRINKAPDNNKGLPQQDALCFNSNLIAILLSCLAS